MDEASLNDVLMETGLASKKGHRMQFVDGLHTMKRRLAEDQHEVNEAEEPPRKIQKSKCRHWDLSCIILFVFFFTRAEGAES